MSHRGGGIVDELPGVAEMEIGPKIADHTCTERCRKQLAGRRLGRLRANVEIRRYFPDFTRPLRREDLFIRTGRTHSPAGQVE